jgi:ubiquinone/menaquinone biosynthesis C-methylase UbiE
MATPSRPADDVVALFDRSAAHYAAGRDRELGFQTQLRIVDRMLTGCAGRLLDIGCGSGAAVPLLRQRDFDVVGMDFSPEMLAHARRQFRDDGRVTFCRGDAESLPFVSESVDHLVCLGLLEYLDSHEQALREAARVLRPGGTAVFSIPSAISPYHLTRRAAFGLWRSGKKLIGKSGAAPSRRNLGVPRRFRSLLQDVGLEPLPNAYCAFVMFPLDRVAPRLHQRIASSLEFLSDVRLLAWTGSQYLVSARKPATARSQPPAR